MDKKAVLYFLLKSCIPKKAVGPLPTKTKLENLDRKTYLNPILVCKINMEEYGTKQFLSNKFQECGKQLQRHWWFRNDI